MQRIELGALSRVLICVFPLFCGGAEGEKGFPFPFNWPWVLVVRPFFLRRGDEGEGVPLELTYP